LRGILLLISVWTLFVSASPATVQQIKPSIACGNLAGQEFPLEPGAGAKIDSAAAEDGKCHVMGAIRGAIGFEIWLPQETWTGRYLQMGCGGLCGNISTNAPQTKGCALVENSELVTASTDMGHRGPPSAWGKNLESRFDFAHRAQHLTAATAKLIIARYYGQSPRKSYFSGCSDGGREGIIAAQRYPEDFDGIVAGAPAIDFTAQNTFHHGWTVQKNRKSDGTAALVADRLPVLTNLVSTQCGGADGVISDPLSCAFDPMKQLCAGGGDVATCLTDDEARFAAAVYDGPRTPNGERVTAGGLLPGSEANWRGTLVPDNATTPPRAKMFAEGVLANLAFSPDATTPSAESLMYDGATVASLADSRRTYDATNTALLAFFARGGDVYCSGMVWRIKTFRHAPRSPGGLRSAAISALGSSTKTLVCISCPVWRTAVTASVPMSRSTASRRSSAGSRTESCPRR
jgi:feruloyl esterase